MRCIRLHAVLLGHYSKENVISGGKYCCFITCHLVLGRRLFCIEQRKQRCRTHIGVYLSAFQNTQNTLYMSFTRIQSITNGGSDVHSFVVERRVGGRARGTGCADIVLAKSAAGARLGCGNVQVGTPEAFRPSLPVGLTHAKSFVRV